MRPVEELSCRWCERWCLLSVAECDSLIRQFFGQVVFFLVATLIRDVDLVRLSSAALILGLQALAHVDIFRDEATDTHEHRAICLSVVECGADRADFLNGLFDMSEELDRRIATAKSADETLGDLAHLQFTLASMACPAVINADQFFPRI